MESEKVKLVDYSSSGEEEEDMEWDQDNIKTDNFGNLEQNLEENVKIGENCQMDQNRMDIRKIAVVQPQKYGTVQNQDNSEGTESDVDFTQNSDENQNLEENLENVTNQVPVPPPSSPVNRNVPLSTPLNFLEAFQAFIGSRGSAEMSQSDNESVEMIPSPVEMIPSPVEMIPSPLSPNNQDSDFICISSDDTQTTEIYSPRDYTDMSTNQSEPVLIEDSLSDTTGMYLLIIPHKNIYVILKYVILSS